MLADMLFSSDRLAVAKGLSAQAAWRWAHEQDVTTSIRIMMTSLAGWLGLGTTERWGTCQCQCQSRCQREPPAGGEAGSGPLRQAASHGGCWAPRPGPGPLAAMACQCRPTTVVVLLVVGRECRTSWRFGGRLLRRQVRPGPRSPGDSESGCGLVPSRCQCLHSS